MQNERVWMISENNESSSGLDWGESERFQFASKTSNNKEAVQEAHLTKQTNLKLFVSFFFTSCVCVQSEQQRELTQIQYLAWPDHGVPDDSTDFLDFVSLVRTKRAGQDQPMVVHCRYSCSFCELFEGANTSCLMCCFGVNTNLLWMTLNLLRCLTCSPIPVLNGLLDFSFRLNSKTVVYEDSCLIVRYLASMRPFAQSFDIYLSQVRGLILNKCEGEIL